MNSLNIFSVRALMLALEQIHSARELVALPEAFFSAVRGLVPAARFSIDQLDLKTGIVTSVTSEDRLFSEETKQRIIELMPSHPVMPAVRAGARGAIRVTDCITQRQFRQTPHYIETLRAIDIQYQMVVTLDIPGTIAGMTVNRDRNFTDKEAMLLHLAAPHIALAHRNAPQDLLRMRSSPELVRKQSEINFISSDLSTVRQLSTKCINKLRS